MAKRMPVAAEHSTLPTRVSVLEHGVQELKTGLDGHRGETRAAFSALQSTLERLGIDIASRASPTNWFGFISAAASAIAIVAAVFGLAEWRVSNAQAPLIETAREMRKTIERNADWIVELRIKQGVQETEHARVRIEQEARIRARVEAEQRAQERLVQPPISRGEK